MNGSGGSPPGGTPGSLPNGNNGGMATLVSHGPIGGGLTPTGSSYGMSTMTMNMGLSGSAPGNGVSPPSLGSSGVGNSVSGGTGASVPQDKQALLANEKRRRRRESHNAVERRRRDNINEKISELATLIPECMLDGTSMSHPVIFFFGSKADVVFFLFF
jgi:Helix-loop-helix DNA-binding domain